MSPKFCQIFPAAALQARVVLADSWGGIGRTVSIFQQLRAAPMTTLTESPPGSGLPKKNMGRESDYGEKKSNS